MFGTLTVEEASAVDSDREELFVIAIEQIDDGAKAVRLLSESARDRALLAALLQQVM